MMLQSGSVFNSVRIAKLTAEWEQKYAKLQKQKKEKMTPDEMMLSHFKEQLESNKENAKYEAIYNKVNSGKTLTAKEEELLRVKNPTAYSEYRQSIIEKETYKNELKNCKTKEEAEQLKLTKMGQYVASAKKVANNPYIPESAKKAILGSLAGKAIMINEVHMEFTQSAQYAAMEDTNAEREEKVSANVKVQNDNEEQAVIIAFEEQDVVENFQDDESSEDTIE